MKGIRKPISKDSDVMVDAPTRKTLFEDCDWRSFMRYVKSVIGRVSNTMGQFQKAEQRGRSSLIVLGQAENLATGRDGRDRILTVCSKPGHGTEAKKKRVKNYHLKTTIFRLFGQFLGLQG